MKFDEEGNSAEIAIDAVDAQRLLIEYAGRVKAESYRDIVSQVNMIRPGLVELAAYVGWFPQFVSYPGFHFSLSVDAPKDFVTVANGILLSEESDSNRNRTVWESCQPSWDIALISAPNLRKTTIRRDEVSVEIYSDALPVEYVESMAEDLVRTTNFITGMLGRPESERLVRVVYSPRAGWGYVRAPLTIVSEEFALAQRGQEFGRARDFKYLSHEIAHYWWHMADAGTPEDWINEGLAEYSSYLVAERFIGEQFAAQLLAEYNERAAGAATGTPIVETENDSPDREVNRYDKPVLLYEELRETCGDERMSGFLRTLYARFRESGATTEVFLDELEQRLGRHAREFYEEALHASTWKGAAPQSACSYADSTFFGIWEGTLVQMGESHRLALRLTETGGALTPVGTDREDIPLSMVRAGVDSLQFRIGVISVRYAGALDRDDMTIRGEWLQGGLGYPLVLTRIGEIDAPIER